VIPHKQTKAIDAKIGLVVFFSKTKRIFAIFCRYTGRQVCFIYA